MCLILQHSPSCFSEKEFNLLNIKSKVTCNYKKYCPNSSSASTLCNFLMCVCMYVCHTWEWETERQASYDCTAYKHSSISQTLFPGQIPLGADLNLPPHSYLVAACPYGTLIKISSSSFSDCLTSLLGMNSCCSSCLECFPSKNHCMAHFFSFLRSQIKWYVPKKVFPHYLNVALPLHSLPRLCSS